MSFYAVRPRQCRLRRQLRRRHPARARARAGGAGVSLPRRARSRRGSRLAPSFRSSDLDLASRLSFFLWSSVPDDALRDDATRGRLRAPGVLTGHVRRMLRDPRSRALVDSFGFQWLKIGKVAGVVPDVDAFPEFDENLRRAMLEETRLFLADQIALDRPVIELVTARHTLRERPARTPLRAAGCLRQPLPPRHRARRHPRRPARAGERADGHVVSESHVAGAARALAPRHRARLAAAPAAARRAVARGSVAARPARHAARADGRPPPQPGLRELPRADGSARLLARGVRRVRPPARRHRGRTHRRACGAARRLAVRRRRRAACVSRVPSRRLRAHAHREAARLRARARPRRRRHAGGAAASCATRLPAAIAGRRSSPAWWTVRRSVPLRRRARGHRPAWPAPGGRATKGQGHDRRQKSDSPADDAARARRNAGPAAARRHDPGAHRAGDRPPRRPSTASAWSTCRTGW